MDAVSSNCTLCGHPVDLMCGLVDVLPCFEPADAAGVVLRGAAAGAS